MHVAFDLYFNKYLFLCKKAEKNVVEGNLISRIYSNQLVCTKKNIIFLK